MMNDERHAPRKPGRPATYVFNKPDSELTEAERKRKSSIEKRRLRQNRSYHRRKALRAAAEKLPDSAIPTVDMDNIQLSFEHERVVPSNDFASGLEFPPKQNTFPIPSHPKSGPFASLKGASSTGPIPFPFSNATASTSRPLNLQDLDSETLAIRWNLPKSSVIPELQSLSHSQSKSSISNLNLSQPSNPMAELSLVVPGLLDDDSDNNGNNNSVNMDDSNDDGTDRLVQNALFAAKKASDMRSAVEKQRDVMRMMGIKDMVFDYLRTQIINMSVHVQNALHHFVVFPSTFDTKAAVAITSSDAFVINEMMQKLIGFNFVQTCGKGRFKLNDTVKMFVKEEYASNTNNIPNTNCTLIDPAKIRSTALRRFRAFFRKQLEQFKGENIHKVGWQREKAMLVYDSERRNMQFAMALSKRKSKQAMRDFLSAAITVMRYCVTASERERILKDALSDEDNSAGSSSDGIGLDYGDTGNFLSNTNGMDMVMGEDDDDDSDEDSKKWGSRLQDLANKARLRLALAEAYFDQLKISRAEDALLKALKLMGGESVDGTSRMDSSFFASTGDIDGTSRVVDSVLVLLLLSNVRMAKRRMKEARTLCVKALRILAAAGLGRSTFGINAMANLTVIYLEENQIDKAAVVATRLVDTLNNMGYQTMPIFADALGVVGMVSMKRGKFSDAEQQFGSALEIVKLWAAKDWTSMPIHHCADLDIRLLENMACAMMKQEENMHAEINTVNINSGQNHNNKMEMAKVLAEQAREMGAKRGLIMDRIQQHHAGGVELLKLAPRHIY